MMMKSADGVLVSAVKAAINELQLKPEDVAAVKLAEKYAAQIDQSPEALDKAGPRLLEVLESLGATPAARARIAGKAHDGRNATAQSRLTALRAAHRTA